MNDGSNAEALGESASVQDKDESVAMGSVVSGGTSRQYPVSDPSTRTQIEPLQDQIIEVGGDHVYCTWFQRYFPRIFEVVGRGDPEALSNLLTNCTTVNFINSKGNTALHHAVASACRQDDGVESFYQCIDLLMSCEQMKVNLPNKKGYTAMGLPVHHLHRTCVERMLKHSSAERLYFDYFPGDRESSLREIIKKIYPELQSHLPPPRMERLESEGDIKLLAALQQNEYNIFSENIPHLPNRNPWYDEPYHSSLLEIACQMNNREQFVKLLLNNGADPNTKNHVTGMPLIHATARSGNFEVLQVLLEEEGIDTSVNDHEKRTVLHWLAGVNERKPGDKEKIEKCIKRLLESNCIRKDINNRDSLGNAPLYITVERGFRDRAKLLLSKGADVGVFERGSKILLSDSLSIVKEILDDCLHSNDKPLTSKDLQLKLNYQPFMNIVPRIAESKHHVDLLTHPVMSTFLTIKWEKVRFIFFLDMVFYLIFLCFLNVCILFCEQRKGECFFIRCTGSETMNLCGSGEVTNASIIDQYPFIVVATVFILLMLLTLREIQQLILLRWVYVQSPENWLELLLIFVYFISCPGRELLFRFSIAPSSALALFLGWSELLIMSGRLPLLSVQLEMLKTVCWTFLKFMVSYVTLLIAFALSFYILFKGRSEQVDAEMFDNPAVSLLKTIIMFTGEFDASDLHFKNMPLISHVIFLIFVVLVAIVLFNLLNGLAVNDTEEIRRNAETLSLAARAKLISRIERLVVPIRKLLCTCGKPKEALFVIYPNRRNRMGSAAVRSLLNIISKRKEPNEKDKSTGFQEELRLFKDKFSDLQFRQDELEKKLDSKFDETLHILRQILTARHEV